MIDIAAEKESGRLNENEQMSMDIYMFMSIGIQRATNSSDRIQTINVSCGYSEGAVPVRECARTALIVLMG